MEYKNKIKKINKDIKELINEYSIYKGNKILTVNCLYLEEAKRTLNELGFELINYQIYKDTFEVDIHYFVRTLEERNLTNIIIYNIEDLNYSNVLILSSVLFHKNIKEIILIKNNNKDKHIMKAVLSFYEPYRILGNILMLRRYKG